MEFQLSYFKSWKMMLWKCCTKYTSKFGKLSSGHRTGKGQFLFQSQRKAMPKNAQTTTQLHAQLCPTLCAPWTISPLSFFVHGIIQARILEWVDVFYSRESSLFWDQTCVSWNGRSILYHWATWGSKINNWKLKSCTFLSMPVWEKIINL